MSAILIKPAKHVLKTLRNCWHWLPVMEDGALLVKEKI